MGATPFERLATYYGADRACPECGYETTEDRMAGRTSGKTIEYARDCPSCGATAVRQIRLDAG